MLGFFGGGVDYCFVNCFVVDLFYRMDRLYFFMPEAEPITGPFLAFVVIALAS